MIITVGGTMGAGKSTLAKKLAKKLNFDYFYMGQIFRDLAKKRNMNLRKYLELGETDPNIDKEVDDYQKKLSQTCNNFVIDGRVSFYIIPNSIKLYIYSSIEIGAERIFNDLKNNLARNEGKLKNVKEVEEEIKKRLKTDKKRYKKYYNIDVFNPNNFDLAINTDYSSREDIFNIAYNYIKHKNIDKS